MEKGVVRNEIQDFRWRVFSLLGLPALHKAVYDEVKWVFQQKKLPWPSFTNFWIGKLRALGGITPEEPIWKICQDMDSRIGIQQELTREPTWRDLLEKVIDDLFTSRYAFCKATGVDQGFLSGVLHGKRNLSLPKLIEILAKINLRIAFIKKADPFTTGEE